MFKKKRKYCNLSDVGSVVTHSLKTNETESKKDRYRAFRDFCSNVGKS